MITDKDGGVLLTRMYIGAIEKMDDKGNTKPFLSKYQGKRLNSPNDLVFTKDGTLWFTDPSFGLPDMDKDAKKEIKFNGVYRYKDGKLTAGHRYDPAQRHRLFPRRKDALHLQFASRHVCPRLGRERGRQALQSPQADFLAGFRP